MHILGPENYRTCRMKRKSDYGEEISDLNVYIKTT